MVVFSLPSINIAEVLEMNKMSSMRSKGHVLRCGWWISIHFVGFCFIGTVHWVSSGIHMAQVDLLFHELVMTFVKRNNMC